MTSKLTTHDKPNGRPCLLTDKLQTDICKLIAAGNYLTTACAAVGISPDSFRDWLQRGEDEQATGNTAGTFSGFIRAVKRAEADREAVMAQRVIDAAMPGVRKTVTKPVMVAGVPLTDEDGKPVTYDEVTHTGGDWLAAMTFLERRYPERWGRPAPGGNTSHGDTYNINIEKAIIDAAGKFEATLTRLAARSKDVHALPAADAVTPDVEPENTIIEGGNDETRHRE